MDTQHIDELMTAAERVRALWGHGSDEELRECAAELKRHLRDAGISQLELAEISGQPQSNISRQLSGERELTENTVVAAGLLVVRKVRTATNLKFAAAKLREMAESEQDVVERALYLQASTTCELQAQEVIRVGLRPITVEIPKEWLALPNATGTLEAVLGADGVAKVMFAVPGPVAVTGETTEDQ